MLEISLEVLLAQWQKTMLFHFEFLSSSLEKDIFFYFKNTQNDVVSLNVDI